MARNKPPASAVRDEAHDVRDFYAPDSEQPFLPEDGIRLVPEITGAFGYRDVVHIDDGIDLVVGDVRHEQSATITVAEEAVLKLHYRLSGTGRAFLEGGKTVDIPERSSLLMLHPEGIFKREWFFAGQHEQSVTLLCTADALTSRFPDLIDELPHYFAEFVQGRLTRSYQELLPLRVDMARAAAALLACELSGSLRRLYAEARAFELLTLSMQSLQDIGNAAHARTSGLTEKDQRHLDQARKILDQDFLKPPTIAALARRVGINEARLMRAFKERFGSTVFDYTQQLRMDLAKKLLEDTGLSVTEIAMDVGYEYSSNFTTAFKRHFGITPKAARDAANP